ncbi:MAG TPA: aspartate kinase [Thermodesulfobacteriota bacterium]|nr:aspartate kinase [Thermodesulfobacteriota bacterium]
MKVIKIGGGSLKGKGNIQDILALVAERGPGHIIVISALSGITDMLIDGMTEALRDDVAIPSIIRHIKNKHILVARHIIPMGKFYQKYTRDLTDHLRQLERLYYGLNFTKEITPKIADVISSFGERLSADLLTCALRSLGLQATYRMPHTIGIITDGKFGDATANLSKTARNLQKNLLPLLSKGMIVFVPGFFGVSETGDITTFGRGGSDYSAAVVAAAMGAEILEVWKDVPGYMSADPRFVPEAQLIPFLSYDEAAELSYFGAKILHPRTIEPLRKMKINIAVKNTLNPDAPGSLITSRSPRIGSLIKSVAHDTGIAILKVHGSGVGARPGILAGVSGALTEKGINIKSVVTSQTCISLLLDGKDIDRGYHAIQGLSPRPFRRLEKIEDVSLVGIVGESLLRRKGIAARCFTAVANRSVNIEMISMGPSEVALYFIVRTKNLKKAVEAIHGTFFSPLPGQETG